VHEPGCKDETYQKLVAVGHMEPTVTAGAVVCRVVGIDFLDQSQQLRIADECARQQGGVERFQVERPSPALCPVAPLEPGETTAPCRTTRGNPAREAATSTATTTTIAPRGAGSNKNGTSRLRS
jgi:hypothetical protein